MQYDVDTPEAYLRVLDDDWRRETLLQLREIIHRAAPEMQEGIRYKMLSYDDAHGQAFALNAQKGYVSFYAGSSDKVDPTGELLKGLDCGKGCIRFKKSVRVADTGIETFIARAAALRRQGGDSDC